MLATNNYLIDKITVIIGADTPIGSAVAMRFAYEGAHVILTAENLDKLEFLNDKIKQLNKNVTLVQLDILDNSQIQEFSQSLNDIFNKVDILINANIYYGTPNIIIDYSLDEWDKIIKTNLTFNWSLLKYFTPLLKISKAAKVIFTNVAGFNNAEKHLAPYALTRNALTQLVREYTLENTNSNIKANIIAIENYYDNIEDVAKNNEITDLFLWLSMDKCLVAGREHYIRFTDATRSES